MPTSESPKPAKTGKLETISRSYLASILVLFCGTFALRASTNMFNTNVPLVAREIFSFNNTNVGILAGLVALADFISITFVNARLKSTWRRRLFILSAFGYCAAFSFVPLAGELGLWVLSISIGFCIHLIMINQANASGVIGSTIGQRERGIAVYTVSLSASLVVGPLINSFVLTRVSLAYSFAAFSIFPIIAALLAIPLPFPKEEAVQAGVNLEKASVNETNRESGIGSFRHSLKNQNFQAAIFNNAMYMIPFAALVSFGGLFAHDYYHASNISVQYYYTIFYSVSFVFRILFMVMRKANLRLLTMASSVLTLLGLALMITLINPVYFVIALAILGVPHALTLPSSLIIISRSSDEASRNTLNSYYASFTTLIGILTPVAIGFASDEIGLRFAFGFVLVSVAVFAYLVFYKLRKSTL